MNRAIEPQQSKGEQTVEGRGAFTWRRAKNCPRARSLMQHATSIISRERMLQLRRRRQRNFGLVRKLLREQVMKARAKLLSCFASGPMTASRRDKLQPVRPRPSQP